MTESPSELKSECVPSEPAYPPKEQMEDNLKMLMHACQCDDLDCRLVGVACKKMKIHVNHTKVCEYQTNGGCTHCRTLFLLCSYHAKGCEQVNCTVINCTRIKEKLQQRRWENFLFFIQNEYLPINWIKSSVRVVNEVIPGLTASLDAAAKKESETQWQAARTRLIEQGLAFLLHAIRCHDPACANTTCPKAKVLVAHSKSCGKKSSGCIDCKQLIEMCRYHSENCENEKCAIPFCSNLKKDLRLISERWFYFIAHFKHIRVNQRNFELYLQANSKWQRVSMQH